MWPEHEESEIEGQAFPQIAQPREARIYMYRTQDVPEHVGVQERGLVVVTITPKVVPSQASLIVFLIGLHLCLQHTAGIDLRLPPRNYTAFHSAA